MLYQKNSTIMNTFMNYIYYFCIFFARCAFSYFHDLWLQASLIMWPEMWGKRYHMSNMWLCTCLLMIPVICTVFIPLFMWRMRCTIYLCFCMPVINVAIYKDFFSILENHITPFCKWFNLKLQSVLCLLSLLKRYFQFV